MIRNNITIEDAKIGFRNFAGKEGPFNPPGKRNFCVFLDSEIAEELGKDGWNIRFLQSRDDESDTQAYLQIAVSYANVPPKIVTITSRGKTILDEESISSLDWAEIETVDLIIRPYNWVMHEGTKNEKSGVKAYVKAMYVTLVEDEFEKKYRTVPDESVPFDLE